MINVTSEELERILKTIEEAQALHEKWKERLHRTFACKLPPDPADLAEDAHQKCAFGNWFYSADNANLRNLPVFRTIGEIHQEMHANAGDVCKHLVATGMVTARDYDALVGHMAKFRGELVNMQRKVGYTLRHIDPLTGVFMNSRLLPDLKAEQEKLKQGGRAYSLLLLNIDLKSINQKHGRNTGDRILQAAIHSIRKALGAGDTIYRYGGAEFVICLPGKSVSDAEAVRVELMNRIGEALGEISGEHLEALNIHYGIVELDHEAYLEELLDRSARSTYTINL